MKLAGRVAAVTGASRGIGRAIALAFAREGASVVVGYLERHEAAQEVVRLVSEIAPDSPSPGSRPFRSAVSVQVDVGDPVGASRFVEAAVRTYGRLDILVNNAGTAMTKLLMDTTPEEWRRLMRVHVDGTFYCTQAALPVMIRAGWGRIVNLSSIWGMSGGSYEVAYSAAKAAVIGFTKALAQEVGRSGVTVNAIAPGVIQTEMLAGLDESELAELAERTPVGRLGTPEEVAELAVYLAGESAAYVTGQVISLNGGLVT